MFTDADLLKKLIKPRAYKLTIARFASKNGVSIEKICEILIKAGYFYIFPRETAIALHKNGVSLFDLVAKYGYGISIISAFFQKEPEFYYGKSVNYLKVTGHSLTKKRVDFICECLACGSVGFKVKKERLINGTVKSCGCLPRGKRKADILAIKNENLNVELADLCKQLINAGVVFNTESKIVDCIKKGMNNPEEIANKLGTSLNYVYLTARIHGLADKINTFNSDNSKNKMIAKTKKVMAMSKSGECNILEACESVGIHHSTYMKYKRNIENEKCNSAAV